MDGELVHAKEQAKDRAVTQSKSPHVLIAISNVMEDLSKEGIRKDKSNTQQGYKFRGIDDVYNALAPILSKHKLVITPRCLTREKEAITTSKGTLLFYVTVQVEFELASAVDGSTKLANMFGEAMDSGDKATNKAMSAAYKYMAMQEFCIPTEGDNDADSTTHEPIQAAKPEPKMVEPKALTLRQRADNLMYTMNEVKTKDGVDKAYKLGAKLCAELDLKGPDLLAEVNAVYEARLAIFDTVEA